MIAVSAQFRPDVAGERAEPVITESESGHGHRQAVRDIPDAHGAHQDRHRRGRLVPRPAGGNQHHPPPAPVAKNGP